MELSRALRCLGCGYDLRAAVPVDGRVVCPECGAQTTADALARRREEALRRVGEVSGGGIAVMAAASLALAIPSALGSPPALLALAATVLALLAWVWRSVAAIVSPVGRRAAWRVNAWVAALTVTLWLGLVASIYAHVRFGLLGTLLVLGVAVVCAVLCVEGRQRAGLRYALDA